MEALMPLSVNEIEQLAEAIVRRLAPMLHDDLEDIVHAQLQKAELNILKETARQLELAAKVINEGEI